ncbi:penicillin-binding protein 1C [Flavobacterium agricola]|uniref:peptidoglycan glycosyltransferase n=1 Tax=Flavobacterium agricola TaxID=2870839 RepID=A0ABY6LWY8_9FLAO|nr:penicillin-binding protein 1C [Flavobacterium agricola]UYW00847.1 penicillin-binding protein 1C [Flavobacterium agricola]
MIKKSFQYIKNNKIKATIALVAVVAYYFCLPKNLFNQPYATVIQDRNQELLGAKIAEDGQWRFPEADSVPYKFKQSLIYFEDEYFNYHFGVNPVAMAKALVQNNKAKKVVRGGSTLTQQVIRLHRKNKKRTYVEKFVEVVLATRLEFMHSKNTILELYASHAPFGGNVVGLDMAAYRYFGIPAHQLSWAESATLAILPNAPSLIYPGKNQEKLLAKRNTLLLKLHENKVIDAETYALAIAESLPGKPYNLPQSANHYVMQMAQKYPEQTLTSTLDAHLQEQVNHIVAKYYNLYKQNQIYNVAVLVADVNTRKVLAYVGNSPTDAAHSKDVDITVAPRSTGSILKPFLYAAMLDEGELLPKTLLADIPTQIANYSPQNYENTYDGAVPADIALSKSLNIPYVLMLKDYTVNKFYEKLKQLQLSDINKQPAHYGLSLILGGAESNLYDLCSAYANMASTLNFYNKTQKYRSNEFQSLQSNSNIDLDFGKVVSDATVFGAGALYQTFTAMKEVNRPNDDAWRYYDSSIEIAWKTGTSFGSRDGWAIGVDKNYVVGVWVGNASGEGRAGLTGMQYAGPILFDVFRSLPKNEFFKEPASDLQLIDVCTVSGHVASQHCPSQKAKIPKKGINTTICPYHKVIHLDQTKQFQVSAACEDLDKIQTEVYFVLPPVMQWYYKSKNMNYKLVPPYRSDCGTSKQHVLDFIYPENNMVLSQTKNQAGELQPVIAKVAHVNTEAQIFWYLNDTYLGKTKTFHEMMIEAKPGDYKLYAVDEMGNEAFVNITLN